MIFSLRAVALSLAFPAVIARALDLPELASVPQVGGVNAVARLRLRDGPLYGLWRNRIVAPEADDRRVPSVGLVSCTWAGHECVHRESESGAASLARGDRDYMELRRGSVRGPRSLNVRPRDGSALGACPCCELRRDPRGIPPWTLIRWVREPDGHIQKLRQPTFPPTIPKMATSIGA